MMGNYTLRLRNTSSELPQAELNLVISIHPTILPMMHEEWVIILYDPLLRLGRNRSQQRDRIKIVVFWHYKGMSGMISFYTIK